MAENMNTLIQEFITSLKQLLIDSKLFTENDLAHLLVNILKPY